MGTGVFDDRDLASASARRDAGRHRWAPILTGSLAEGALDAVRAIAGELRIPPPGFSPNGEPESASEAASLAGGRAGQAVMFEYLAKADLVDRAAETGEAFLDAAALAAGELAMPPSLFGGFPGVAWAVAHLDERSRSAGEDPNEDVDAALHDHLTRPTSVGDYDLVNGLVGLGVYALERQSRPGARDLLAVVVDRLDELSEPVDAGVRWRTRPEALPEHQRRICPGGHYNLGVAHGVPGVIALLGGACVAGIARERARRLLDGAVGWLLSQELPRESPSAFPMWTAPGIAGRPARSAWCYGDPGIAAALLCAARAVGNPYWEGEALTIARRAAARRQERAGVRDAGLCHGAAGLGHLFNRLWQATGDPWLAEAACFWFARTVELRQPGRGIAGYAACHSRPDGTSTWVDDPGLLTGAAGIALALLAAATPVEPAWDRMLLASLPPPIPVP